MKFKKGMGINIFCGHGVASRGAAEKVSRMPLLSPEAAADWIARVPEVRQLVLSRAQTAGVVTFDPATGMYTGTNQLPAVGWERMPKNKVSGDVY